MMELAEPESAMVDEGGSTGALTQRIAQLDCLLNCLVDT